MPSMQQLINEKQALEADIQKISKTLESLPEGRLICRKQRNIFRYYLKVSPSSSARSQNPPVYREKYMCSDDPLLLKIARREYLSMYLKDLTMELNAINSYLKHHREVTEVNKYLKARPGIRQLLTSSLISNKTKYSEWANVQYPLNTNHPEHLIYITDAGFYVRSKSEQMIANMLLAEGIPFRYEDPVTLVDGFMIYPDFHIFSLRNYKEYYWEHNGMMLQEDYYSHYINHLCKLRTAGIVPGVNLLQTFEAEGHPLEPGEIRALIQTYLK